MFQFTEQTWLQTVKEEGPAHGLGAAADQISRGPSGRYQVTNPAAQKQILQMRYDPAIAARMAGAFTERNRANLTASIGRAPSDGELYVAHFLGAQGAADLVHLATTTPGASAAAAFPAAAAANHSIFYDGRKPRSVGAVYADLVGRHVPAATAVSLLPRMAFASQAPAQPATASDAEPLALAESGPVFYSMFHTGRRTPVSSFVSATWAGLAPVDGVPTPATDAGTAPVAPASAGTAASDAAAAAAAPAKRTAGGRHAPINLLHFLRADAQAPAAHRHRL
jgi:hypothetical protein